MEKMDRDSFIKATQARIVELQLATGLTQKHMSELMGYSSSYIRNITNGVYHPSLPGLFDIMEFCHVDPAEFFSKMTDQDSQYNRICARLRTLDEKELSRLETLLDWRDEDRKA